MTNTKDNYSLEDLQDLWERKIKEIKSKQIYMDYFSLKSALNKDLQKLVDAMKNEIAGDENFMKWLEAKIEEYAKKK